MGKPHLRTVAPVSAWTTHEDASPSLLRLTQGEWLLGWGPYLLGNFLRSHGQAAEARTLLAAAKAGLLDALGADDAPTTKAQATLAEWGA